MSLAVYPQIDDCRRLLAGVNIFVEQHRLGSKTRVNRCTDHVLPTSANAPVSAHHAGKAGKRAPSPVRGDGAQLRIQHSCRSLGGLYLLAHPFGALATTRPSVLDLSARNWRVPSSMFPNAHPPQASFASGGKQLAGKKGHNGACTRTPKRPCGP
jgi:hypothetical protein